MLKWAWSTSCKVLIGLMLPTCGLQAETRLSFFSEVETDSNASFAEQPQRETRLSAGVTGFHEQDSTHLVANLSYSASASHFQDESFEDEQSLVGRGYLAVRNATETFSWFLSDIEELALLDRAAANTPANRVQRSVVSTGPRLALRLTPVDTIQLGASYTRNHVESELANDSETLAANSHYVHQFNALTSMTLGGFVSETQFEAAGDYQSKGVNLGLTRKAPWGVVDLLVGTTRAEPENAQAVDASTYRIDYQAPWQRLSLSAYAVQSLTDGVTGLTALQMDISQLTPSDSNITDASLIESKAAGVALGYPVDALALTLGLSAAVNREDFVERDQTDDNLALTLTLAKVMTERLEAGLSFTASEHESALNTETATTRETRLATRLAYQAAPDLNLSCWATYTEREAATGITTDGVALALNLTYRIR